VQFRPDIYERDIKFPIQTPAAIALAQNQQP